jgi:hypothetical protein
MKHFARKGSPWEIISIGDKYVDSYPLSDYVGIKDFTPEIYFGDDEWNMSSIVIEDILYKGSCILIGFRYILKEKSN